MKVSRFSSLYVVSYFVFICCMLILMGCADLPSQQTEILWPPERPLQIDVITFDFGDETVDVRDVARNLQNKTLYDKAFKALAMTNNVCLSSGTVNLLTTALNDDSAEVRQRAISLLGYSRNPEAIDAITDSLQNDPSWRVRKAAAMVLGLLAGEAAVSKLKAVLNQPSAEPGLKYNWSYIKSGARSGLAKAGGAGVPLLIKMLNDEVKRSGGHGKAMYFIQHLESTLDRRVIRPLIDIISQPESQSDPNWEGVREHAGTVLAHFATELTYASLLKARHSKLARGFPVTPSENRQVTPRDRARIREVLENAGYDIKRLDNRFVGVTG